MPAPGLWRHGQENPLSRLLGVQSGQAVMACHLGTLDTDSRVSTGPGLRTRSNFPPHRSITQPHDRRAIADATHAGGCNSTKLVQKVWRIMCYIGLHQLWLFRNAAAHRDQHRDQKEAVPVRLGKIMAAIYQHLERLATPGWHPDQRDQQRRLQRFLQSLPLVRLCHAHRSTKRVCVTTAEAEATLASQELARYYSRSA
jgi:hypothetical protein